MIETAKDKLAYIPVPHDERPLTLQQKINDSPFVENINEANFVSPGQVLP